MNRVTMQIVADLKQALNTEVPTLIGQANSFSYHGYTNRGKPRKGETFKLIDGTLLRIGRFHVIQEDNAPENPPTPKVFDIIRDSESNQ